MSITALPTPPDRSDPATFSSRADAFLGALPTFATDANALAVEMQSNLNLSALGVTANSVTSLTVGTGSKTLTIETGKGFAVGMTIKLAESSDPMRYMIGVVTAHNSGTGSLTFTSADTGGAGTYTSWVVSVHVPLSTGAVPIDAMIAYKDAGNSFTSNSATYLKTGVIATAATYPNATAWTLSDAATWVARTGVSMTIGYTASCASGNGITVITQGVSVSTTYMTTTDGMTFTSRSFPTGGYWRVAFGNGIFLATDFTASATTFYTSTDGINWTSRTVTANATGYGAPIFGEGKFVIPAGNTAWLSTTDGITYTAITGIAALVSGVYCSAYGNGVFVTIASAGGGQIATSTDGIAWVTQSGTSAMTGYRRCVFGNGVFAISTGSADGRVYISPDGVTWNAVAPPLSLGLISGFSDIAFGNGTFFFTSGSSTATAYKTRDFITWETVTLSSATIWDMAAFSSVANCFCAFDAGTTTACSSVTTGSYVGSPNAVYAGGDTSKPFYVRVA